MLVAASAGAANSSSQAWSNSGPDHHHHHRGSDEDNAVKSSDDDEEEEEEIEEEADDRGNKRVQLSTLQDARIRVGRDYQAVVTVYVNPEDRARDEDYPERALLVWCPSDELSAEQIDDFVALAKERCSYDIEQALGMLFWHKHCVEKAVADMENFVPFPDDWSPLDKLLFETAYEFHGKHFKRLQQMLPDKTIASLVKHYYSWKKTRLKASYIDKLMEKNSLKAAGDAASVDASGLLAVDDAQQQPHPQEKWGHVHRGLNRDPAVAGAGGAASSSSAAPARDLLDLGVGGAARKAACTNCSISISIPHQAPFGNLCASCYKHWWVTGNHRPFAEAVVANGDAAEGAEACAKAEPESGLPDPAKPRALRVRPPAGISIDHDDLLAVGKQPMDENLGMLRKLDDKVKSLRRLAQKQKQWLALNEWRQNLDEDSLMELEGLEMEAEAGANGGGADAVDEDNAKAKEEVSETKDLEKTKEEAAEAVVESANAAAGNARGGSAPSSSKQRWTKDHIYVVVEGFRRFGVNVSKIAGLLDTRSETDLLRFLNTANAEGYSALFLEALKEYESCHGRIPDSDKVRSLVMGKWTLPAPAAGGGAGGGASTPLTPRSQAKGGGGGGGAKSSNDVKT